MQPLYEQYRPQSFDDVIGQNKAIRKIEVCGAAVLTAAFTGLLEEAGWGKRR